jgi:hypothetical protein
LRIESKGWPWQEFAMAEVMMELERMLAGLTSAAAKKLESRVREEIALVKPEDEMPSLEKIKRRCPEFADVIGCWADVEFELPPELPMSPAKI